ncbi:LutC/YkgG family protein [Ornithinicoccus halotolerans]|uniref:LutC/YkgG family protein n=1 Tax=Ornithinicoccus halotolerans TaxID=1748220 RepID=UPI001295E4B4|nr:LUD domain-containing protein [Ornithinicoccus halotolerans]
MTGSAREEILSRVRAAVAGAEAPAVPRGYRREVEASASQLLELLADRLRDYRAEVVPVPDDDAAIAQVLADQLTERGLRSVVAPQAVARAWLAGPAGGEAVQVVVDDGTLTWQDLDGVDAVVTGAALAIAETGVVVLDGDAWCGRRAVSLVPDLHLCVVRGRQVVGLPTEAVSRLQPTRPQTWIAGPSATSDIELDRVEGVHGPRTLVVLLAG